MSEVLTTVQDARNAAKSLSDEYVDKVEGYVQDGVSTANSWSFGGSSGPGEVAIANFEPPPYVQGEDMSVYYGQAFRQLWKDFDDDLRNKLQVWMDTYFPAVDDCVAVQSDAWLCETIEGTREIGLPAHVVDQMWLQGREQIIADTQTLEQKAIDTYTSMGYTLPSTVLADQISAIQLEGQKKMADHVRSVTIESAKIKVDVEKFAIEQAIKLRLGVAAAMGDLIRAWAAVYSAAADAAKATVDAKLKMHDSAAAWINAMASRQRAIQEVGIAGQRVGADFIANEMRTRVQQQNNAATSLLTGAEALAKIAAGALAAQNTSAGISYAESDGSFK